MAYSYDSNREQAYMEGPLSSATTSLLRVTGELPIFIDVQETD